MGAGSTKQIRKTDPFSKIDCSLKGPGVAHVHDTFICCLVLDLQSARSSHANPRATVGQVVAAITFFWSRLVGITFFWIDQLGAVSRCGK